ncbi:MAG: hypothetical protein OEX12_05885 [Gammaproteobacteria bacterium]|nr:hypothetical protein [Gammaproteobacteria bacterium]
MPISIHNKEYHTVAERVAKLRETEGLTIETQLISHEGEKVIMKALIMEGEKLIATGYAEEVRGSTNINKTSALENCETSAVGRALAFYGLAGTEIASADEVANAIAQQSEKALYERFSAHMEAVIKCWDSIAAIKEHIATEAFEKAAEAWDELSKEEMKTLWLAPTKGGVFTTKERDVIKSDEFANFRRNK